MQLFPFQGTDDRFSLSASALIKKSVLFVTFELRGALSEISNLQATEKAGLRKNELWKHTCFEWFLKPADSTAYWECNIAPGGDWNLYSLSDYRKNLLEEKNLSSFSLKTQRLSDEKWSLHASFDLSPISPLQDNTKLLLNLSAVLELTNGQMTYWSLSHTQSKADFHHPNHFVMELTKEPHL